MGVWRRLLSIYIHLFSPLSREWASPLKKQLLVSGQPQAFPPPSAHTSGSRCCNRESQGFVFVRLTQSASQRSSVEREACSLFWWTWTPRMWVRSAQGHNQRFQTEAKATGGGANTLGRRDDIIPFFLEPALRPPEFQCMNREILIFVYFYYITTVCVHIHAWVHTTYACICLRTMCEVGSLLPCGYWGATSGWPGWGASTFIYQILLPAYLFTFEFSVTFNQEISCWLTHLSTMNFWNHRVIKGRCPSAISCNVTKVFEWRS